MRLVPRYEKPRCVWCKHWILGVPYWDGASNRTFCNATHRNAYHAGHQYHSFWDGWGLLLMILLVWAIIMAILKVAWGNPPQGTSGIYTAWFLAQKQEDGLTNCCGDEETRGGDGHYVDVRSVDAGWEVKIDGEWIPYPKPVNPYLYNATGRNVVWYTGTPPNVTFYCLRLSNGT